MNYPEFSHKSRVKEIERLSKEHEPAVFDAVIIGGGIVGASVSRELQIRGLKTLVVEKGDFASGTSSKSSKLIHGGLRYLEMMDFGLVFESLGERHWLLKTHPHLVQPLEFNLPIYNRAKAPKGARPSYLLGMGLWLYDALSLFRTPFFHGRRPAREVEKLFPEVKADGLKGAYYYADAMMLDDELVLETMLDAVKRGATGLNYVAARKIEDKAADGTHTVRLADALGGDREFAVRAKEVIVCVGPWTDRIDEVVGEGSARKMKPSKGVHLIVPWSKFPVERCFVMYAPDGRIIFAIPRRDLGTGAEVVIIGTTDSTAKDEKLEDIRANRADVEYLFGVLRTYFPGSKLSEKDVCMTFAGVRPLLDDGAKNEAKTSREHEIWRSRTGIVFMAGGKYTTFRKIAQEVAEFAFPQSRESDKESKAVLSTPADYERRLGGRKIWGRFTDQWVKWKIEHHAPCTLADIVFRRGPFWMAGEKLDLKVLDEIAEIARPYFGWSSDDISRQKIEIRDEIRSQLKWN